MTLIEGRTCNVDNEGLASLAGGTIFPSECLDSEEPTNKRKTQ